MLFSINKRVWWISNWNDIIDVINKTNIDKKIILKDIRYFREIRRVTIAFLEPDWIK